ncbi:MAG TPA: hypothetical protein VGI39_35865 [Polyangiaceae bacterium]
MKTLRGFGDVMTWIETGKRTYELRAGSDVVATLSWAKGFGSPGVGETADGKVLIERAGLLRPRVVVREDLPSTPGDAPASQRAPLVTLDVDLGGRGLARSRSEVTFNWAPQNLWRSIWAFEQGGKALLTFESEAGISFATKVKLAPGADTPDLGALLLLGSAVAVFIGEDSSIFGV